jgi:hypothetical protein
VVRCGSVIRSAFLHRAGVIRGCRSDNQQPLLFLPLRCIPKDVQSTNQVRNLLAPLRSNTVWSIDHLCRRDSSSKL